MDSFCHDEDLIKFIAHAFTTVLAMQILKMDTIESAAAGDPGINSPQIVRRKWLSETARNLVSVVWEAPPSTSVADLIDSAVDTHQTTQSDEDESDDDGVSSSEPGNWCICSKSNYDLHNQ